MGFIFFYVVAVGFFILFYYVINVFLFADFF